MVTYEICKGNPGALMFLMAAYELDMFAAEYAFQRMYDNRITGTLLYMLWNDCCERDTGKALRVMRCNTIPDIEAHINAAEGRGIPYRDDEIMTRIIQRKDEDYYSPQIQEQRKFLDKVFIF